MKRRAAIEQSVSCELDATRADAWRRFAPWRNVDADTFANWRWQERNAAYTPTGLQAIVGDQGPRAFFEDLAIGFAGAPMTMRLTPYLLSMIDWSDPFSDPLRRQFLPLASEAVADHPMLTYDPLREQADSPMSGLTHRYRDRALLLALDTCPVYCRYCTRSYAVGTDVEALKKVALPVNRSRWSAAIEYIASTPAIEDVIISGGDAYRLKPDQIRHIGHSLLDLPSIQRIRFATKGLAVMPMKVLSDIEWTRALLEVAGRGRKMLKEISMSTHFNHPNEVSASTRNAMKVLMDGHLIVRNQSVLLRGVNDDVDTMRRLIRALGAIQIHPYYVYMCDMVRGVEGLRTSLARAIELEKQIRGCTAGFNTPTWIVDMPRGGGKRDIHSFEVYDQRGWHLGVHRPHGQARASLLLL